MQKHEIDDWLGPGVSSRCRRQDARTIEDVAKMRDDPVLDIAACHLPPQKALERGDAAIGDPARHNQAEVVEVGGHVERKAMTGDPARETNADCRQLIATHPRAGEPFDAMRRDAVIACCANQNLFEVANVPVNVAAIGLEVDNGVADELTGAVIGDVAATSCFVDVDASSCQLIGRREDVAAPAVPPHAERQDVRMFEEEQQIVHLASLPFIDERALQRECVVVRDEPERPNLKLPWGPSAQSCA